PEGVARGHSVPCRKKLNRAVWKPHRGRVGRGIYREPHVAARRKVFGRKLIAVLTRYRRHVVSAPRGRISIAERRVPTALTFDTRSLERKVAFGTAVLVAPYPGAIRTGKGGFLDGIVGQSSLTGEGWVSNIRKFPATSLAERMDPQPAGLCPIG